VAHDLLDAIAGHEQVEIGFSPLDQCLAADFGHGALAARSEVGFGLAIHERSRFANLHPLYLRFCFSATNCFESVSELSFAGLG
jgi:hypothetical protein